MQGRRKPGNADDVQPPGDTRQPQVKPPDKGRPLITADHGAVVGAVITAAASLLIYSFSQIRRIDERLDKLEQEAMVLIGGDGKIRPSIEALETKYHLEALQDRIERLETQVK
jgi:hypothetical protein